MSAPARLALAALSGAALMLAFPPYDVWPVAPLAVAVLALLTRGLTPGRGALVGMAAGLGFFVPLLHWSGIYVGAAPWLILAVVQAGYLAPFGAASALAQRLPGWPVWVAALWVGQEALRTRWPYGGFPWGRLAFSQADAPTLGWAALGGAPLVTFAVALAGSALAWAALSVLGPRRGRYRLAAAATAGAATAVAAGVVGAGSLVPATPATGPTVTVAVVQGNVPRLGLDFNAQRQAVLRNHATATTELADRVRAGRAPAPDLVVWPENSSDIDPYTDAEAAAVISAAVDDIGVPVLVGAVVGRSETTIANTAIVWSPATAPSPGPGETYVKRHPVPFAEYIPMRRLARRISAEVDRVRRDFVTGGAPGVLTVGPARVADVICFEIGYDDVVKDAIASGGQVLVVQTNNATFGFTPQTEQQLVMSRMRAVEHGRTVLVAATSGVSAVIDPDGSVRQRAEVFTRETFVEQVALSDARTLATRLGGWPEAALTVLGLVAVALALATRRTGP